MVYVTYVSACVCVCEVSDVKYIMGSQWTQEDVAGAMVALRAHAAGVGW
jgi:hypothetical protein